MKASPDAQRRAAEAIGRGLTLREAARAVGVHERTVRRWLRESPELRRVAERARETSLRPDAISSLEDALLATKPGGAPDHVTRTRAAVALLQHRAQQPEEPGAQLPEGAVVVYPDALGPR